MRQTRVVVFNRCKLRNSRTWSKKSKIKEFKIRFPFLKTNADVCPVSYMLKQTNKNKKHELPKN